MPQSDPTLNTFLAPTAALLVVLGTTSAWADVSPGAFVLKSGKTTVQVTSWGKDCGQKPTDQPLPSGGQYTLTERKVLDPVGNAPPLFQTGICRAATSLPKLIEGKTRNGFNCSSPVTHATQVKGRVSWKQEPPHDIRIKHSFQYEWRLEGSHCKVSSLTNAHLTRSGEAPIVEKSQDCSQVGPPAEIQIKGRKTRRLRKSRKVSLDATVVDAKGCPTGDKVTWTASKGTFTPPKTLSVKELGIGEKSVAEARFKDLTARVKVIIASPNDEGLMVIPSPAALTPKATQPETLSGWTLLDLEAHQPKSISLKWLCAGAAFFVAGLLVQFRRRK